MCRLKGKIGEKFVYKGLQIIALSVEIARLAEVECGASTTNYTRAGIRLQGRTGTTTGTRSTRASTLTYFVAVYRHATSIRAVFN